MGFPLHLKKLEKEATFWGKDKLVLSPAYRIVDPLKYLRLSLDVYGIGSVGPTVQKEGEEKK